MTTSTLGQGVTPNPSNLSTSANADAAPIPAARRSRPRRHRDHAGNDDYDGSMAGDDNDEGSHIDPNEFDLMLSRSVQSGGPMLEPESFEYSMLRNTRRQGSRSRSQRRQRRRDSAASPYPESGAECGAIADIEHQHQRDYEHRQSLDTKPPHEETPLLFPSPSTSSSSGDDDIDPKDTTATPYLGGISPARFWTLFLGIMVAYFVACFDSTIMASSHPVITSYFGSSNSASWLSTAFLLTSTAFQPLLGGLSDAVGRKGPYIATMSIFLISTLWCTLAQSMTSFILARAACGLGAGGMMTLGSIIISDLVPIEIRGAYQSYINITFGVGAMLGAGLGGMMADYLGWRWEFGVQIPILVVSLVIAVVTIPHDLGLDGRETQPLREAMKTFDSKGSILMSTSVTFLILGLSLGGNVVPWSHPYVVGSLTFFAIFFPLFLYVETIATKPIMPMHLVQHSPHMNLIFSNHIAAFLSNAILFNVPLFFQGVLLTSATTSGLRLVICSAVASAAGTATGFLITYTRRLKWPLVVGAILLFFGCLSLAAMQRGWPAIFYLLCLVPGSAGQGFQFPGTFMAILAVADQRKQAVVTSTLILWRSLGMVLGVAVSSLLVQNALWGYLEMYVSGPDKEAVIELVRQSVESIRDLEPVYREQVVQSYEAALRLTFLFCSVLALISVLLVLPVKLPRLGSRK
ncbi:major facilitator superfamily domain-containing protein [Lasiosphaeris hirsuta]|uniref:Major facilitator superfamily domain-containing protein n=1 Tax=Lasiosphaeris hirsuta TaxID=260670 RepID=A0AA40AFN9_9PEZI|nr:major facilitator superfamily domain-containing protein [Lasiosphaeris hirsuta]